VRAAFKAVQDAKQVAVLVPTTFLSHQHLATFSDRMAPLPVVVRELSRFTGPPRLRRTRRYRRWRTCLPWPGSRCWRAATGVTEISLQGGSIGSCRLRCRIRAVAVAALASLRPIAV
jgi:hypothetical protein